MKKRIISTIILLGSLLISCDNISDNTTCFKDGIVITLQGKGAVTKADPSKQTGVTDLNENKVCSLSYYIYDSSDSYIYSGSQSFSPALEINEPTQIRLNVSEEDFDVIFNGRTSVKIYVVTNVDASTLSGKTALSDIAASQVSIQNNGATQNSFVMSGEGTVTKTPGTTLFKATGAVSVSRSLAKITLDLNIRSFYGIIDGYEIDPVNGGNEGTIDVPLDPENPDEYDEFWVPQYQNMVVTFHNGAAEGSVGGNAVSTSSLFDLDGTYPATPDATDGVKYIDKFFGASTPYYTYARTWSEYQPSATANDTQPYFLIMLPWQKHGQSDFQNTWYKMIFNSHEFTSNTWYNITLQLDGLGSLSNGEPIEITPLTFTVSDWRDSATGEVAFDTVVEIQDEEIRVLALEKHDITLFNENTTSVKFTSSHPVEIESVSLMQYDYSSIDVKQTTTNITNFSSLFHIVGDNLVFTHTLDNDLSSSDLDYRDYYYTVRIRHADNHDFTEELKILQHPAMSIVSELTRGHQSGSYWAPDYLFVNGNSRSVSRWDTVEGTDRTSNNRNMYVITVSQFASDSDMEIGDPRTATPTNAAGLDITGNSPAPANAPALYGTTPRTLTYYYQTSPEMADEYKVAPKFRFCSAYGQLGSNSLTLADATKRCAAYQEDGYPAGRWRLPSTGELLFIANICAKELIPPLFSSGQSYWTATGAYRYNQENGGSVEPRTFDAATTRLFSRCVYDEWYWENTDEMVQNSTYHTTGGRLPEGKWGTFVWGDMPL